MRIFNMCKEQHTIINGSTHTIYNRWSYAQELTCKKHKMVLACNSTNEPKRFDPIDCPICDQSPYYPSNNVYEIERKCI